MGNLTISYISFAFLAVLLICVEGQNLLVILLMEQDPDPVNFGRLRDGPSIQYKLDNWPYSRRGNNITGDELVFHQHSTKHDEMCGNAETEIENLTDAITRAINYYEEHVEEIKSFDGSVGLQVLEGVLNRISKRPGQVSILERSGPLIAEILKRSTSLIQDPLIKRAAEILGAEGGLFNSICPVWKSSGIILPQKNVNFSDIGNGPETSWAGLNTQCLAELVKGCEVPYACRKTYLDAEPQSQYMLTHQALYLLFAKHKSCDLKNPQVFRGWEAKLEAQSAKMLLEAELIAQNGFPEWGRDLFAEYVFITALAGYPNLIRSDWTREISSWQSISDFGCFIDPGLKAYSTTDEKVSRTQTVSEKKAGLKNNEICLSHFSATSLSALAVRLGWLHDNCLN